MHNYYLQYKISVKEIQAVRAHHLKTTFKNVTLKTANLLKSTHPLEAGVSKMHRAHVVNSLHSIYWDCVLLVLLYFNYRFSYDDEDIFAVTLTSGPSSNGKGRAM